MTSLRILYKIAALIALCVVLVPLQVLVRLFTRGPASGRIPMAWHRGVCRILGLRVELIGTVATEGATLFVGNHVSHFDIFVLGSRLPACFIAKDDMAQWPLANRLCALQDTVFISRRARDAIRVTDELRNVARRRRSLILFPEGTTSDGRAVAPFKSSVFSAFVGGEQTPWTLQPFTLELLSVDGRAIAAGGERDAYAFHGDIAMFAHLRHFLGLRGARLRLVMHPPRRLLPSDERKALAASVHATVASGLPVQPVAAPFTPIGTRRRDTTASS